MLSDQAARQAALEPANSFIVQAPAGSGKTALLVYRLLRVLATVEKPEQVLAITFTRKATAEMRERVLELLHQAESGESGNNHFEETGIELARFVLQRDRLLGWQLLKAPDQLRIHTIDSLCSRLAGSMPWLSRLGDTPKTSDDTKNHYSAAVDRLFASLLNEQPDPSQEALKTVLLELDFNYSRTRRLLIEMLARRDQWLRHLVANNVDQSRQALNTAWQALVSDTCRQLDELLATEYKSSLIELTNQAAQRIPEGQTQLSAFKKSPLSSGDTLSAQHWQDLRHLLTTANAKSFRTQLNINIGFPTEEKEQKQALKAILEQFKDDTLLLEQFQQLAALPNGDFDDSDWQQLKALQVVLLELAAHLQLEFRANHECDHNEVAQRALWALSEVDNPTNLALHLDYRLDHILVDEFQDTSRTQLELLRLLTAGWTSGDGRSLFLVGDPMQSIYRFREADVSLFLQVAHNQQSGVFDNLEIQFLQLSENFRSGKNLVNWFNEVFSDSFPQQADVISGAIQYAPSTSNKQAVGEIIAQLLDDDTQQADFVVGQITEFLQQPGEEKIAVLVASRNHLSAIVQALEGAHIAYAGVDIKPLAEVAAIQDMLTLCKTLCRPHDRMLWLALLRSPLVGLTLRELYKFGEGDIWTALQSHRFGDETASRLQRFIPVMQQALAQRQQVPLHALTRWTWEALGGLELQQDVSNQDIEQFFNIIALQEQSGDAISLTELDQSLDGLYAQPDQAATSRVILSTIHRAKGLQYHTVILPSLDRQPPADGKSVLMWSESTDQQGRSQLLLAPIRSQQDEGQHFAYLRYLEKQRAQQERTRVMYVACTRAEQRVVLLARSRYNRAGELIAPVASSLLATVWRSVEPQFERHASTTADSPPTQLDTTLSRLPAEYHPQFAAHFDWRPVNETSIGTDDDDKLEYQWATSLATAVGNVLHAWLEHHSNTLFGFRPDKQQIRQWRAQLRTLNVPSEHINRGIARLTHAIKTMQTDPHAKFVFANYADAENELALTRHQAGKVETFVIDRTFVTEDNIRWVVDYKTTVTQQTDIAAFVDQQIAERHQRQLNNYGQLMAEYDSRPVMLAVYFPMLGEFRSWPHSPDS